MKSKILTFFLCIIMTALIFGIIYIGYIVFFDLYGDKTAQTIQTETDKNEIEEEKIISQNTNKKNPIETIANNIFTKEEENITDYDITESKGNYYYEQLTETQKKIYNGLQQNKNNLISGNYVIEYGNQFYDILEQEKGEKKLGDDYQSAIEAFSHDNVDLFYLDISKLYLNIETKKRVFKTTYNVYIKPSEGKKYYVDGFTSKEQVQDAMKKLEQYKQKIKSKMKKSSYDNVKMIHDFLIDHIKYDDSLKRNNRHSIYGALIEKKCVCEGYTRAFKYLADSIGIESIFMQGTATNTEGQTENHAWNAVNLYGTWFLIDATWDDPIIVGEGYVSSNIHYKYFLKGTDSFYKDHNPDTKFTKNGRNFSYPKISKADY